MGKSSAKSATAEKPVLNKSRAVLIGDGLGDLDAATGALHFATGAEEHFLPKEIWEEMGRPDSITVTVRPGDHLNK